MNQTCDLPSRPSAAFPDPEFDPPGPGQVHEQLAVLAGGCFWCTEGVFRQLDGVINVTAGYTGGSEADAAYETVCSGRTGHVEAIAINFNPQRLSYGQLLKVFFSVAHDPTHVDRQGNDVGTQYRSAIFYLDPQQQEVATRYVAQLDAAGVYPAPIATTVEPFQPFYRAEEHHQDYAARNPAQPYIVGVAAPKIEKVRERFAELVVRDPEHAKFLS